MAEEEATKHCHTEGKVSVVIQATSSVKYSLEPAHAAVCTPHSWTVNTGVWWRNLHDLDNK